MCGIAGAIDLNGRAIGGLGPRLGVMNELIRHRGPDGTGEWMHEARHVGFTHRRLTIIDLDTGDQPMTDGGGNWITYNGEIYNYKELRSEIGHDRFRTTSDTEVILQGYRRWGADVVRHLRGMFSFALWDEERQLLLCARDRFGIKPFYYAEVDGRIYFASEAKALLPFLPDVQTDEDALGDYLAFQSCLEGKTLFKGIRELVPGHTMRIAHGRLDVQRYWEVFYELDFEHTSRYFERSLHEALSESVRLHLRADVPVGTYLSGGLDSSIVAGLARDQTGRSISAFNGRFDLGPDYDESAYAAAVADARGLALRVAEITPDDFIANIGAVVYHMDYPAAGPGSFSQFMVSKLAASELKVVLGGQGGDELFGGYARYLIAYFEQVVKAAIDGTMGSGKFIVDYESILPNLRALQRYKPMLQEFWRDGLFDDMSRRYFRLVNRSNEVGEVIRWDELGTYSPFETFRRIFDADNLSSGSYLDRMTHFDFKALLPALLQVEDRMSMAHGLESRLPFLDHPLVELAATIPSDVKFEGGQMKRILRTAFANDVPPVVLAREDKMGFPTPLIEWSKGAARDFVMDTMTSHAASQRGFVDNRRAMSLLETEPRFGRGFWGLLSLELWQQRFHDRKSEFSSMVRDAEGSRV